VSLLAVRNSKVPLKSFSIEFEDIGLDESEIQRELSHQLGTEHHAIRVSTKDIVENFVEAVLSAETLVFRSAFVPMFMLSKLVRESNIKTVLTGEGADELFGGYDIFKEFLILTDWATIGDDKEAATQLQKLYPYLPQFKDNRARFALPFYRAFLQDSEKSFFGHRVRWSNYPAMANLLAKKENITTGEALSTTFAEIKQHSQDCQCRVTELMTLLHGYLLSTQGDRMASANSVETRLPFLDEDVTKIAMNYTLREQLKGMNEKQQLRNAFLYDLPKLYNRKKRPYLAPDAEVFFKHAESFGLQDYFSKESIASHGVFDPEEVTTFFLRQKEIYEQGRRLSRRDNTAFFTILSAMILHNHMPSRLNPKNISHLIKRSIIL
jgi:asparagine synthase (glutamine-hydrolysing)